MHLVFHLIHILKHDFMDDYKERYDFYHKVEKRTKFDLDLMNKITKGGLPDKTLNVLMAGTGVGKSLFMCHMASKCLSQVIMFCISL